MQLYFDTAFGVAPFPGPSRATGEAWVGERELLDILETHLGLSGVVDPDAARAAAFVPSLRTTGGPWTTSLQVSPLGVGLHQLRLRDELWEAGWRGEPLGIPRIDALAPLAMDVRPGKVDRLAAVLEALSHRGVPIERLFVLEDRALLPLIWRDILTALEAKGTEVATWELAPATGAGDIEASREGAFTPAGDGTLTLFRPAGVLAAAEEVAAWVSTRPVAESVVIIGATPVLDRALKRAGVPVTGAPEPIEDNLLLQILPLVLALAWDPPDPARVLELLTLPISPIPRGIAWRLAAALQEWPAVGSPDWACALAEGLQKVEDESRREILSERLSVIFSGNLPRGREYPVSEVNRRVNLLTSWAVGRRALQEPGSGDAARFDQVRVQLTAFSELVGLSAMEALPNAELQRFVEQATAQVTPLAAFPAEAGVHSVRGPGEVAGPCDHVVWWDFTQQAASNQGVRALRDGELPLLEVHGIQPLRPGQLAARVATTWRRPWQQARRSILLVCPHHSEQGEKLHPHPLWDEILVRAEGVTAEALLTASDLRPYTSPRRVPLELRSLPAPQRHWQLEPGTLQPPERHSPTGLEKFLGCSFAWALHYLGRVFPGATAALPSGDRLHGSLVHHLIAKVLEERPDASDDARQRGLALYDDEAPQLAAPLFLPGGDADRATTRHITGEAAAELVRLICDAGRTVHEVERERVVQEGAFELTGKPDLVLSDPPLVLDLKQGRGTTFYRKKLLDGTALQLAAYSRLLSDVFDGMPQVAYFLLRRQRLLLGAGPPLSGGEPCDGSTPQEMWQAVLQAEARRRQQLEEGALEAPAISGSDDEAPVTGSEVIDGLLLQEPNCKFCDYDTLCGRAYEAEV